MLLPLKAALNLGVLLLPAWRPLLLPLPVAASAAPAAPAAPPCSGLEKRERVALVLAGGIVG